MSGSRGESRGIIAAMAAGLAGLSEAEARRELRRLPARMRREINDWWPLWSHPGQRPPPGDWRVWMIRAGRGFGKTRAGAEWVSQVARERPDARIALVAATAHDARRVMVEGESGLLAVAQVGERLRWRPSIGELRFASGAYAYVYSAEAPEALRGPQHHLAWCDELAKWRRGGDATWDNLMMGMRLDDGPRTLVTTTPRPTPLMRWVAGLRGLVETRGRTDDNGVRGPHQVTRFEGYAAVWDRVDRAGDVMRRGAFAGARVVPLLWQHRGVAVGVIDVIAEDARGLRVEGSVSDPRLAALVRSGAVAGLSVGYRAVEARQGARREVIRADLAEVSLVAVPMQPLARVDRAG